MRKILKILYNSKWILNKKGIAPLLAYGALAGGGALMNLFGKKKQEEEPQYYTDPWTQKLRDIAEPRMSPSYYDIQPSSAQTATGQQLTNRLSQTPEQLVPKFGAQAAQPYYQAAKERMGERFGEENTALKDILQREGVLTSTPGIEEQMKLKRSQGAELEELNQKLMYEDIARDVQASQIAENILSNTLSQGIQYGNMEFGQKQWPYTMAQETLAGAQGLGSVGYMPERTPSIWEDIGGSMMDIGGMGLGMGMLNSAAPNTNTGWLTNPIIGGVGGQTTKTKQYGNVWSPYKTR